jgi:ankyrin repeat protein
LLVAPKPADIKIRDPEGYSLLHLAAEKGNLKIVKELVEKGLEVN